MDIKILVKESDQYPQKYASWKEFPDELYYVWNISLLERSIVWVVWPRKPWSYVSMILSYFLKMLPEYDCVTISGWAKWIDMSCHRFCLIHDIPTIMVLWWSIDHALTSTKRWLIQKIVEEWWLVLSQFSPWTTPAPWTYPQRNVVIALLSNVMFVPWWALWSGTMSTVWKAIKAAIPVCTVPWPLFEESCSWTNNAIVKNTVISVDDLSVVFHRGNISLKEKEADQQNLFTSLSKNEIYLLQLCAYTIWFEELLAKTWWAVGDLISSLWLLEWLWYISQVSPSEYVKTIA